MRGHRYTSGMIKRIALLAFLSCLLAACGNKGPLVMPDKPQADAATATAPAPAPAPAQAAPAQPAPADAPPSDPTR